MDARKYENLIARRTAEQLGMKITHVLKIIRQYHDAILKIVDGMDLENVDTNDLSGLKRRAIYVPGLGKFVLNRKYLEAWQNKYKAKEYVED